MPAGKEFTLCRTGRGLAASRRPFGDARLPVRHSAAWAEVPPYNQATQFNYEVSTLSGDLTNHFHFPHFHVRLEFTHFLKAE